MLEKIIRVQHVPEKLKIDAIKAHLREKSITLADLENKISLSGDTPLHLAVSFGLFEVAMLLIDLGANINAVAKGGQRPVHYAAESGHPEFIIAFGYKGALLNEKNEVGDTPMHKSVQGRHPACVLALLKASNFTLDTTVTNLQNKTPWDCLDLIEDLKMKQALAEALATPADYLGRSPFHVDVIHGDLELVKVHANSGAPINEQDKEGDTALHLAVKCGHPKIVHWFCHEYEGEINLDIQNNLFNTPLHISAEKKDTACIKFLVSGKKSARKDIKNYKGMLPEEILEKWSTTGELKILKDALASSYLTNILSEDYENELFPPDPPRPAGCMGFFESEKKLKILAKSLASPHFERKSSRRLSEGSKSQIKLVAPALHRKSTRPIISLSRQEMLDSTEADLAEQALAHPNETEEEFLVEKAFETHDLSHLLNRIKNVTTANDCQFILEDFKKFIKKIRSETANNFLQILAENLVPISTKSEKDFVENCTKIQKSFHQKLCADGLRKMFAIKEINTLTINELNAISTDEETQKKLQALVILCSGVPENAKRAEDYLFDSLKLQVKLWGSNDCIEVEEIIFLLSKLNLYFSNIQKLMSHYIVFNLIKKSDHYGYNLDQGRVAKSIDFYFNNICDNATKTLFLDYKNLLYNYKTSSAHSLIQQINSLITNTIFTKKESIISTIDEYMSKSPAELKNTEREYQLVDSICRAFTEIITKFYQSHELRIWRGKCFDMSSNETPELFEHTKITDMMSIFIIKKILSYGSPQKQAQAMNLFLLVAREAFHNQLDTRPGSKIAAPDFTTPAAVYIATLSSEIPKNSFLDKDAKKIEMGLSFLFCPLGGFKVYEMLQAADHRILPFIPAIIKKKTYFYEFQLYGLSENLGAIYDVLIFVKNRLSKVVFLDNPSDLEEHLQQLLKDQSSENDVPVRKQSSDRQRLSQPPPSKEIISPRKLSIDENAHAPRKKSSGDRKPPKIKSLENNPAVNVEHPDEDKIRRASASRKSSLIQATSPRKELQESLVLKQLAAETKKLSERKVPIFSRGLSNENRLSSKIHSDKHVISPQSSPRDVFIFPEEGLVVPSRFSSGEGSSTEPSDQEGQSPSPRASSESSLQSINKTLRKKFSLSLGGNKPQSTSPPSISPRIATNPASMFHTRSSSSEEENPKPDTTLKKEFS